MSLVVQREGTAMVAWGGAAEAVIFRDRAGRMIQVLQPGAMTRELAWPAGATSAEVAGAVAPAIPYVGGRPARVVLAATTGTSPLRGATETRWLVAHGQRVVRAASAAVIWAITGLPVVGSPVVCATTLARQWTAKGRATVERVLPVLP
jgi:hypothetical protein